MIEISTELKDCIVEANQKILKNYLNEMVKDKQIIRRMINLRIDKIIQISTSGKILERYGQKGITAVSNSIYLYGNSYPHYLSIIQAKAKSTRKNEKEIIKVDFHAPIFENYDGIKKEEISSHEKDERFSSEKKDMLEFRAAHEALKNMKPSLIMTDGALTRYYNYSRDEWEKFKREAVGEDTIVVGIIEDIDTSEVAKRFKELIPKKQEDMFDSEILFGVLDKGEYFILNDWEVGGIKRCFTRFSDDQHVICIEYLERQEDRIKEALTLLLALTPEDGRGIPLWLDIVGSEVNITEKMGKALIETYISPEIRYRILSAKREKRK